MPGWLDSAPTLTAEQTRLADVQLVGNYAVSPHWGDGHHTGYYTFDLLRHQCPCAGLLGRSRAREPTPEAARDLTVGGSDRASGRAILAGQSTRMERLRAPMAAVEPGARARDPPVDAARPRAPASARPGRPPSCPT